MKTTVAIVLAFAGLGLFASMPACGGDDDSTFKDNGKNGDGGGGTSGGTSGIGASGGTSGGTSGGPEPVDDGGACAAKNADAARKPAYLFFILDQSFSMAASSPCLPPAGGACTGATPAACCTAEKGKRWTPITTALDTFIHDPLSEGITAGLELFPSKTTPVCNATSYATTEANMDVKMTPLNPQIGTAFSSKWPATPTIQNTPTKAVFQAIGPIAKKWATDHTDGQTAIVLLTDGVPQGCTTDDDKIDNVAIEVAKYSDTVPVYVIGVSDNKDNLADLQKLATAGKTTLTLVDTSDPAKTQKAFLDRIDEIRKTTLSCDVSVPPAPEGLTLDLNKVNVSFTTSKGAKDALTYDEKCTGTGNSWHFDSTTAPTKISLCAAACDAYKADPAGSVGVEFGCQRRDDGVK